MRAGWLALMLLVGSPALASDPTLIYRAPSLVPRGGAWTGAPPAPTALQLHTAEINLRAQRGIEATMRDSMRRIDDDVIVRMGNPRVLPQVRAQRVLEEELAAMRQREGWRRIEADLGRELATRGLPLGPTTRRVLERSGVEIWVRERRDDLASDLGIAGDRLDAGPGPPELGDVAPREPRFLE